MTKVRNTAYIASFGKNLRKIRKSKKISQEDLAFTAGISLSQVGRIERGEINPTISSLLILAKSLGVHPKELLDFEFTF